MGCFRVYRYSLRRESVGSVSERASVGNPGSVVAFLRAIGLHEEEQECLLVLILDTRNNIRGYQEVTRGLLDQSLGHPREIFRFAVINNAKSIIMAHNHPSGSVAPSSADIQLTENIAEAGGIIGIRLTDHVIIGEEGYYSFVENGML